MVVVSESVTHHGHCVVLRDGQSLTPMPILKPMTLLRLCAGGRYRDSPSSQPSNDPFLVGCCCRCWTMAVMLPECPQSGRPPRKLKCCSLLKGFVLSQLLQRAAAAAGAVDHKIAAWLGDGHHCCCCHASPATSCEHSGYRGCEQLLSRHSAAICAAVTVVD